ncbi:MAG: MBL fold metallo-hydrolase [Rhodothermales bacterium]|nr:MBL fold metallo-hydrolase [Rhodothermales bacterium]
MLFLPLGDTEAIGASCFYLRIDGTGLMLDAGADPEAEGEDSLPRFGLLRRDPSWYVDHAIVTHAHHDHIGALPVLVEQFPHVLVHMTRATRDLAEFVLPASARLQARRQREGSSTAEPLFDEKLVEVQSWFYLTHNEGTPFDVTGLKAGTPVKACFYPSGHILGAAGVLLTFEEDGTERRVFYTSDTNLRPQAILPGGEYPEAPVEVLILEATLGADPDAEQTTRRTEEQRFGEALRRVVERGGTALVPVFALGRAQEMLALVDRFKSRGVLPDDVPVYTAGGLRAIADIYDKTRYHTPRLNPDFEVFGVEQLRLPRSYNAKRDALAGPSIHIVSSGMMFEGSLSNWAAQHLVEDEKNAVLLVGFAKEDSPADRLLRASRNGTDEVVLDATVGPQPLRAEVERFRFSGHSHRRDLLQLVERLQPQTVLLVHGEDAARRWMADNIRFFYPEVEVRLPERGEVMEV